MIMENKYFVPEISDLRVGYECEIYEQSTNKLIKKVEWHPVKVITGNSEYGKSVAINRIPNYLKQNKIRVPYLTKEAIESEGWLVNKNTDTYFTKYDTDCPEKTLFLHVAYEHYGVPVWVTIGYEDNDKDDRFSGACPSINELSYIQKLLGI